MSRPPDIVGGRQGSTPRVAAVFDLKKGALSAVCARAPEPRARAHGARGPAKLAVDNYAFGEHAAYSSWVILSPEAQAEL